MWPQIELECNEKKNVGIVVDYFSGDTRLFAMKDLTAKTFINVLKK